MMASGLLAMQPFFLEVQELIFQTQAQALQISDHLSKHQTLIEHFNYILVAIRAIVDTHFSHEMGSSDFQESTLKKIEDIILAVLKTDIKDSNNGNFEQRCAPLLSALDRILVLK